MRRWKATIPWSNTNIPVGEKDRPLPFGSIWSKDTAAWGTGC